MGKLELQQDKYFKYQPLYKSNRVLFSDHYIEPQKKATKIY